MWNFSIFERLLLDLFIINNLDIYIFVFLIGKIILCDYILDFDFDGLLCLDEDGES